MKRPNAYSGNSKNRLETEIQLKPNINLRKLRKYAHFCHFSQIKKIAIPTPHLSCIVCVHRLWFEFRIQTQSRLVLVSCKLLNLDLRRTWFWRCISWSSSILWYVKLYTSVINSLSFWSNPFMDYSISFRHWWSVRWPFPVFVS